MQGWEKECLAVVRQCNTMKLPGQGAKKKKEWGGAGVMPGEDPG